MSVRQPPPDKYSDYSPPEGYARQWVECDPSEERLVDWTEKNRRCRRLGCKNPVAWALLRSNGWWFYCADHHYGRKIEGGKLLQRRAVETS